MKGKTLTFTILSVLFALGVVSCGEVKRGEYAKGTASIFCDDGFRTILDEEIGVFEYTYPESSIIPFYMSEQACIDSLLADQTQSIIVTKELTPEQIKFMKSKYKRVVRTNCIAVDAVALIVNKKNPVQSLSVEEVGDLLNGRLTHWNQLAGADTTAIKLVFDNAGSSTVSYLRDKFLPKGASISDKTNSFAQETNAQVFDIVKKDPDAIGVISVSWLGDDLSAAKNVPMDKKMEDYQNQTDTIAATLTDEVNIIKISNPNPDNDYSLVAYKPYQAYIATGEYPLYRKVYMISTAPNSTLLHSFYTFITGFVGQKIISKTGILPYHMNPRVVQLVDRNAGKK
ncbi:MAG: substrate-binding domain-containing protein [Muribaculaceae bacterium]|nr:hypothetical protein [Bacteroides sp.]MDE7495618.1 substrate-binding domain-containing protein [Muribaculaceae bacterium]